jgi:hypothetical protein
MLDTNIKNYLQDISSDAINFWLKDVNLSIEYGNALLYLSSCRMDNGVVQIESFNQDIFENDLEHSIFIDLKFASPLLLKFWTEQIPYLNEVSWSFVLPVIKNMVDQPRNVEDWLKHGRVHTTQESNDLLEELKKVL